MLQGRILRVPAIVGPSEKKKEKKRPKTGRDVGLHGRHPLPQFADEVDQAVAAQLNRWAAKAPKSAGKPTPVPADPPPMYASSPSEALTREEILAEMTALQAELLRRGELALQKKKANAAREKFSEFVKQGWKALHPVDRLDWNWHLEVIADHCQHLAESLLRARKDPDYEMPDQNLVINVPPRSLKTEIVGIFFPAWLWVRDPALSIRYMSGNDRVRKKASRDNRDLITSEWYRECFKIDWTIRADADNVGEAANTKRGYLYYSTYEMKITGEGTDVIINDDPVDADDADSEVKRPHVNGKWDSTIENRVNHPKRAIRLGIMQRLHEEDWSGYVLAKGSEWRHLCLPAEYESVRECKCSDCAGGGVSFLGPYDRRTEDGELLHPERFGPKEIAAAKRKGTYFYAGQHQQRPAPAEGGLFKRAWWKYFDPEDMPRLQRAILFGDCANKKKLPGEDGSRTSFLIVGQARVGTEYNFYVLDNRTGNFSPGEMFDEAKKLLKRWPAVKRSVIELAVAGSSLIESMQRDKIPVEPWSPKNDSKESRAAAVIGDVEFGKVLLPRGAPWLDDFLHELSVFPNGKHDDQVDALTMALVYLQSKPPMAIW